MSLRIAIVADDLTGALDTSAPFVAQGFKVAVALTPAGFDSAVALAPDVLVINTASRALSPAEAENVVRELAERLKALAPAIVLKKIDSRLKGNLELETRALAEPLGLRRVAIAPAVPDQGRMTRSGMVVGTGVENPIAIAPLFARLDRVVEIADAESADDLDRLVTSLAPATLYVGARGLGAAFARRLAEGRHPTPQTFAPSRRTLLAFGSRDPITGAQIDHLARHVPGIRILDAPQGQLTIPARFELPAVLRCTGEFHDPGHIVASRFATGIVEMVRRTEPETIVIGGGDTALGVLTSLGLDVAVPLGEAAPGVPWLRLPAAWGSSVQCLVKSGGFGSVDVLCQLVEAAPSGQTRVERGGKGE